VDQNGHPILPNPEKDDTYLGIEKISGLTLEALQRLQMNFYIKKDDLYNWIQNDLLIVPLTFVRREAVLS
jgi:hypothetical protein